MARCYAQGLQTDAAIGQLIDSLESSGEIDNTLIIVTADHGDAIASHGAGWDKYSTYTEEVGRVPLVIRWPEKIEVLASSSLFVYQSLSASDRLRYLLDLRYFLSDWALACCFHLVLTFRHGNGIVIGLFPAT